MNRGLRTAGFRLSALLRSADRCSLTLSITTLNVAGWALPALGVPSLAMRELSVAHITIPATTTTSAAAAASAVLTEAVTGGAVRLAVA